MFGFLKKKRPESTLELPPPPSPPGFERPAGDIPPIQPLAGPEELPEAPSMPEFPAAPTFEHEPAHEGAGEVELPEVPAPELPEAPVPEEPQPVEEAPEPMPVPELTPVEEQPEVAIADRTLEGREMVRKPLGPTFVSVDEYRAIMENSNRVRAKLMEAEGTMRRLSEIKGEEEKTFDRWRAQLEDVERKLAHVDRVIAKAKR
jgi:hypothetical protein